MSPMFDANALVMAAAVDLGVHATAVEEFAGPLPEVRQTAFRFPTPEDAAAFAARCLDDRLPARAYGAVALVLHE